jgi:thiopurine S-methyltransferase
MKKTKFDKSYWEHKYENQQTGWNIGYISTPIKTYIDQLKNKDISILIPGAGNSFEAEYLYHNGFKNTTVLDIAKQPLLNLKERVTDFPENHLIQVDFFEHKGSYDLILEQTFFCALDPSLRNDYAKKMNALLHDNGKLVGLLFDFDLDASGPPFGGSISEYEKTFQKYFTIKTLSRSINSIKPRQERELFIIFEKKNRRKL